MEALTQKIFIPALVAVIKTVAIVGLLADVAMFYTNRNAGRISGIVKRKINHLRINSLLQLTKN